MIRKVSARLKPNLVEASHPDAVLTYNALLTQFLDVGATHGNNYLVLSQHEVSRRIVALSSLQELGVIVRCDDASVEPSEASKWQLSETASSCMVDCVTLSSPCSALDPRPGLELFACNTHELMLRLSSEDFEFVLTSEGPKTLQQREPYCPHAKTGKKVYVHPYRDIPHSYMLALLLAKGRVQHGLTATAYAKMCGMSGKKGAAAKPEEDEEFEFQSSAAVKEPKPVRPGRGKARKSVQGKQKRVKVQPVDVSLNPQSFKKAPTTRRRVASTPKKRFRLMKKTKMTKSVARTSAKRTFFFNKINSFTFRLSKNIVIPFKNRKGQ